MTEKITGKRISKHDAISFTATFNGKDKINIVNRQNGKIIDKTHISLKEIEKEKENSANINSIMNRLAKREVINGILYRQPKNLTGVAKDIYFSDRNMEQYLIDKIYPTAFTNILISLMAGAILDCYNQI